MIKRKKLEYKKKIIDELQNTQEKDPKTFWNTLSKLKNIDSEAPIDSDGITPDAWLKHFKDLATKDTQEHDSIQEKLDLLEKDRFSGERTRLDYPFTISEIKRTIKGSKNGKSPSDDLVLYEMLKSCVNLISPAVTKLFNIVLDSETFPDLWNMAYQVPIFKGGDVFNTNDYRGISITSCLGKLFNKALNNRLQLEIEYEKQLHDTQAAFRRDFSTTDQIFILNSLLNKYVRVKKRKLYACFVDFRKAFDSIWHNGLLYKLLSKFKIGGKFYGIIKHMYNNARSCIKLKHGITCIAVREGDYYYSYFLWFGDSMVNLCNEQTS